MAHKDTSKMEGLENIGWDKMSAILDKEMPIKKKRRLAVYWWIGGAAAAIFLALSLFPFTEMESPLIPEPNQTTSTSPSIIQQEDSDSNNPITEIVKNNTLKTNTINTINQGQQSQLIDRSKAITNRSSNASTITTPIEASANTVNQTPITQLTNFPSRTTSSISEPMEQEPLSYIQETYDFKYLSANIGIHFLSAEARPITIPSIRIQKESKFQVGIETIFTNSPDKSYSEYGVGLSGLMPINKRWNLIASLSYMKRGKLFGNQDISKLELTDVNFSSGALTDPLPPSSFVEPNNINLGQLSLSLGAQYDLSSRLAFNGSIIPSYSLINTDDYNQWYLDLQSIDFSTLADSDALSVPKKWNVHLGLGISYSLLNNLNIGLNYNYLLTSRGQNTLVDPNFESNEWQIKMSYLLD